MSKVKYIKVNTADRLPEKGGTYLSELGEVFFAQSSGKFEHNYEAHNVYPEFWLSPVPDREEEMREMLEKVLKINHHHKFNGHLINEQIEQLLNELKPN